MVETAGSWEFRTLRPNDLSVDPTESEFFREEGIADAITRESIQNSMDARHSADDPVIVRIGFYRGDQRLSPEKTNRYFQTLRPHLKADEVTLPDPPTDDEPMSFIVIEDFNTNGLRGDPKQYDTKTGDENGPRNDFYYFWRNRGRSLKGSTDRGRWGVGKLAFSSASRAHAFWGYTRRSGDDRALLMGLSLLQVHHVPEIEEERFAPDGYYSRLGENDLALPLDDCTHEVEVQQFREDFSLKRNGENGLSVVIPYPDQEGLSPTKAVRSAILHYFYPILAGDLEVVVSANGDEWHLKSDTIRETSSSMDWSDHNTSAEGLDRLLDFTEWILGSAKDEIIELNAAGEDGAPGWVENHFGDSLEDLRDRYEDGERIALRAPIIVKPVRGKDDLSYFDIYLVRDPELGASDEHYIREGLTIPDIRKTRQRGIRAMVVVEDDSLSSLIGDAENPAHTTWSERADRVNRNYKHGATTVRYVKNAIREIAALLSRPAEGKNEDLLRDYFYLEEEDRPPESGGSGGNGEPDDNGDSGGGNGEAGTTRTPFQISQVDGGFAITGRSGAEVPKQARVKVAYDTGRGDPFRNYSPIDFRLTEIDIQRSARGAYLQNVQDNQFDIVVEHQDFRVKVSGFDRRRDLTVRVQAIEQEGK